MLKLTTKLSVLSMLLFCLTPSALAREVAGVKFESSLQSGSTNLVLNGVGIRSKFFFKIYVGALYLSNKSSNAGEILASDSAKTVIMHFLYKEVSKEKLVSAWNDGFSANLTPAQLKSLKEKIDQFNTLNTTVKNGDRIVLSYEPGKGTEIMIKNKLVGTISGLDFHQALLKIWIGKNPVTGDLKKAMLGK